MKTKTLLIAAAALAAGVMSSQAQVYSQNIVGYVNINLTNGIIAAVAPALDLDGTGTNNTISTVFTTPAVNDTVYVFNGTGYDILQYIVKTSGHGSTATSVTNWYESGVLATNYPINPGRGAFYLPAATETATIVGDVLQGTSLTNQYFPAANELGLIASKVPIGGGLTSVLGYNPNINDTVYIYDNGAYDIYQYIVKTSGHGSTETFTTNWFNSGVADEPVVNVGESFWIQPAVATNWVETFNP